MAYSRSVLRPDGGHRVSCRQGHRLTGMRCELGRCPESATHLVHIWFPDALDETWRVCRAHDRYLKVAFSRSRPRPTPSLEPPSSPRVHCRQCDQPLNEPVTDAQDEVSQPCPYCGSVKRHIRVRLYDGSQLESTAMLDNHHD